MRNAVLAACTLLALLGITRAANLPAPTTTLAAETSNNTSASKLFAATGNGDLGPGNVSKVDTHTLFYPGFTGKIYAHLMGWFCMNAGSTATGAGTNCSSHVQIGYNSNDPAVVKAQVNDMISRGFDGVIHDWYGPGKAADDLETRNYMAEAQLHPGFTFALMIDQGAIKWYSCYPTCTATQALLNLAQYASANFFSSPAYMRINGRPVLTNFAIDSSYSVDWNYVSANTPGNPIFLFQNNGGFTHALSGGSYSWVMPGDPNFGLDYLSSFYNTGMSYPSLYTVGATYKGFNDTLASWSANRVMSQQCGQTWQETFAQINAQFNSSNQLDAIQLVTWDDYEEGTEIETGIDNCVTVSGAISGSSLRWSITGNENTVDHYTVFISADGSALAPLGDFAVGTAALDLSGFSFPAGNYWLLVKAVGKPSLRNQMSAPVAYSIGTSSATGSSTITPAKSVTIAATPSSAAMASGQSGQFTLAVGESGASDPVSLSCSNLPAGMTCSFSAATVTPGTQPATVSLTVTTAPTIASRRPRGLPFYALWMPGALGIVMLGVGRRRRVASLLMLLVLVLVMASCGGSQKQTQTTTSAAGTYTVVVMATSGGVSGSTHLTITVQ
ncbi:MAG: hypothetical protein ACR2IF_13590 [Terriglobales bacterium]